MGAVSPAQETIDMPAAPAVDTLTASTGFALHSCTCAVGAVLADNIAGRLTVAAAAAW